jgi:hypothetical protein
VADSVITPVDVPVFIGERAQNLFRSRQMYCSEAVLVVLNNMLGGGLTENQASALAAPFAEGVGRMALHLMLLTDSIKSHKIAIVDLYPGFT